MELGRRARKKQKAISSQTNLAAFYAHCACNARVLGPAGQVAHMAMLEERCGGRLRGVLLVPRPGERAQTQTTRALRQHQGARPMRIGSLSFGSSRLAVLLAAHGWETTGDMAQGKGRTSALS
jgi:hypothetical protein